MSDKKAEKISVSMDPDILGAVQGVADLCFGGNRSAYLESVSIADLERRGALPGSPVERVLAKARALIEAQGPEAVEAKIDQALAELTAERAAGVLP